MNFKELDQNIIAVQAPKPNMFTGFWQLVIDQNVTVIVMITKLTEKNKVKADKYWPDEDNPVLNLENGISVTFESEEAENGLEQRSYLLQQGKHPYSSTDHKPDFPYP